MVKEIIMNNFFNNFKDCIDEIEFSEIEKSIKILKNTKNNKGRLFILGVGGSAGNASHAVNDFRKLCEIETYTPTDNVSEITARTNDEGFETVFEKFLEISKLNRKDTIMIFSVGGGNLKKKVSINLINAIKLAKRKKVKIISVLGRTDGYAYKSSDARIVANPSDKNLLTPISESFQTLIWHYFVSDKRLQSKKTKW